MDWRRGTRGARAACRRARFDALVSFAQPWSDHLIGLRVHRATGLPWIAHFSDPWTDSPYLRGRRLAAASLGRMEARRHSNGHRDRLREFADRRSRDGEVPAGVALEGARRPARIRSRRAVGRAAGGRRRQRLTLVHAGRFYDGIRTPEPMLRALATLATTPAARSRAAA